MVVEDRAERPKRVTATVTWTIYHKLCSISDNIDFGDTRFEGRHKRNRSAGSALAFIAELALTDPEFVNKLIKYMEHNGKYFYDISSDFNDRY